MKYVEELDNISTYYYSFVLKRILTINVIGNTKMFYFVVGINLLLESNWPKAFRCSLFADL